MRHSLPRDLLIHIDMRKLCCLFLLAIGFFRGPSPKQPTVYYCWRKEFWQRSPKSMSLHKVCGIEVLLLMVQKSG